MIAHSARNGRPAQPYKEHVLAVASRAEMKARNCLGHYRGPDGRFFEEVVSCAAEHHDLGKLMGQVQAVLAGRSSEKPLNHVDAGVAKCLVRAEKDPDEQVAWLTAAVLIHAHHRGLFNHEDPESDFSWSTLVDGFRLHLNGNLSPKESWMILRDTGLMGRTDRVIRALIEDHNAVVGGCFHRSMGDPSRIQTSLFHRMMLSCLVEGDHHDSAMVWGNVVVARPPAKPRWDERMAQLRSKVASMRSHSSAARQDVRRRLFEASTSAPLGHDFYDLSAEVGTGKTTASMMLAMKLAQEHHLERVIVVAPYTAIIDQHVEGYRDWLTLGGEDPREVVAEHHHRSDYGRGDWLRIVNQLWDSPVVVTTAVQFFETLASNGTSRLRKMCRLPGSVVVLDESHACLPDGGWRLAARWLRELTEEWGCRVIFSSGTTVRYWDEPSVVGDEAQNINPVRVVSRSLTRDMAALDENRVRLGREVISGTAVDLAERVAAEEGPRLVICSTIVNAAMIAWEIRRRVGSPVYMISTLMTPRHRREVMDFIYRHQAAGQDFTVVGTSCINCGVNISARVGFREGDDVASFLQTRGRVNRGEEFGPGCMIHIFQVESGDGYVPTVNPLRDASRRVLYDMMKSGSLNSQNCTAACRRERDLRFGRMRLPFLGECQGGDMDEKFRFQKLALTYRVIEDDGAQSVLIPLPVGHPDKSSDPVERLMGGKKVERSEVQMSSISLSARRIADTQHHIIEHDIGHGNIVNVWGGPYDDLLGVAMMDTNLDGTPVAEARVMPALIA